MIEFAGSRELAEKSSVMYGKKDGKLDSCQACKLKSFFKEILCQGLVKNR